MKHIRYYIIIFFMAIILVCSGVFIGLHWDEWFKETNNDTLINEMDSNQNKNNDSIDIPGFDIINFKANSLNQEIQLYNPYENTCYFRISLYFNDGTLLWQSDLLEPGEAVQQVTIQKELEIGIYENCILKYDCFQMNEELTPLNGSQITFTMNVS